MRLLVLCLVLSGCASTTIYDRNGRPAFRTQADCANIKVTTADGVTLEALAIEHSPATIAGGQSVAIIGTGVAKAAVGIGTALATPRLP